MSFVSKLRERKVARMAIIYCIVAWGVLQVADIAVSVLGLPDWALRATLVLIVLLFPLALILSWMFKLTPQGLVPELESGKHWASSVCAPQSDQRPAVAVLPFSNSGPVEKGEYLADGVTGEILHGLTRIEGLRVPSRICSFRFKGIECSVQEAADKLRVDHILKGAIGKSDAGVKLSAELLDAATGAAVWSQSYEGLPEDIPLIEEKIAQGVGKALKVDCDCNTDTHDHEQRHRPANPDAYLAYLKGRHALHDATGESCRNAVSLFQDAIELEQKFPRAWAGLSLAYTWLARYGLILPTDGFPRAKTAALKALELDQGLAEAHLALAEVQLSQEWDFAAAEASLLRALELEPDSANVHLLYGHYLSMRRRYDEAVAEHRRAVELDPLLEEAHHGLADTLFLAGRYEEALNQLRRIGELAPGFPTAHLQARIALAQGRPQEALTCVEHEKLGWRRLYIGAIAHFRQGDVETAGQLLTELIDQHGDDGALQVAIVYAQMGEREKAFDWLQTALENHDPGCVELQVEPELEPLRSDPRFAQLIEAAGLGNGRAHN